MSISRIRLITLTGEKKKKKKKKQLFSNLLWLPERNAQYWILPYDVQGEIATCCHLSKIASKTSEKAHAFLRSSN